MKITVSEGMPSDALIVRTDVFVTEQGFVDEFDDIDPVAVHFMAYDGATPIGTCRAFLTDDGYVLGRLCVQKAYRGKGIGKALVKRAEQHVSAVGGQRLRLHSQYHAIGFYESIGYTACSEVEDEQGCPHVWMEKVFA